MAIGGPFDCYPPGYPLHLDAFPRYGVRPIDGDCLTIHEARETIIALARIIQEQQQRLDEFEPFAPMLEASRGEGGFRFKDRVDRDLLDFRVLPEAVTPSG